ncbi:hypothetical protein PHET_01751 [Paragonimus heterotremus]|uniref:Uncharacterized protein n=1 Tax=Paragonimus heterotremus TaxID=100268 RepID=A0A8J4TH36_9TREM|nr:hypothetical protein PHET_01751 [Paragonimus heterotremus]
MLGVPRTGRSRLRKQNTYQICPQPFFTFSKHRKIIQEILHRHLEDFLKDVKISITGEITPPFVEVLDGLRDSIGVRQQKLFPRHKFVVHGIVGTTGDNEPTVMFATQTFMSKECGDDSVGVCLKNAVCFVSVMVAGLSVD